MKLFDALKKLWVFLEGKKTFIGGVVMIFVAGLYALGHISETEFTAIEGALLGMGFITQRLAIQRLEKK